MSRLSSFQCHAKTEKNVKFIFIYGSTSKYSNYFHIFIIILVLLPKGHLEQSQKHTYTQNASIRDLEQKDDIDCVPNLCVCVLKCVSEELLLLLLWKCVLWGNSSRYVMAAMAH